MKDMCQYSIQCLNLPLATNGVALSSLPGRNVEPSLLARSGSDPLDDDLADLGVLIKVVVSLGEAPNKRLRWGEGKEGDPGGGEA